MPAIYDLANRGLLPPGFSLVGFARRDWADQDFGKIVYDAVKAARPHAVPRGGLAPAGRGLPVRARHVRRPRGLRPARRDGPQPRGGARHRRQPRVLPVHPARLLLHRLRAARPLRPVQARRRRVAPGRHREAVRPRPQERPRAERHRRAASSRPTRSSASTTTWARRRCRTCWRCASPTRCSSRSGTPTTSTTCRSPWPRTSASAAGPATTTASAPRATSSRTTCSSCSRSPRWRSRSPSTPRTCAPRRRRSSRRSACPRTSAKATARGQYAAGWQGGEEVVGYLEEDGVATSSTHRDLRRDQARDRHPPLGGGAVLPAHRQAARQAGHRDRGGLQAGPAPAVQPHGDRGARARTPSSSGSSPTRASPCGSAPRCPVRPMEVRDVTMDFGYGRVVHRVQPRGLRAADPRRPARRPAAVPAARGGRAVLADPRPGRGVLGQAAAGPEPYAAGGWGPQSADEMMSRDGRKWRMP